MHTLGDHELALDNGQHILIGAYEHSLDLMRLVGLNTQTLFQRTPFRLSYPDGWHLQAVPAPAPMHLGIGLLRAKGMTLSERLALVRWQRHYAKQGWTAHAGNAPDTTVAHLLSDLPPGLVQRLMRPLCLAALNTEPHQASAHLFLRVLQESLGGRSTHSHLLIPRLDLSGVFARPALHWLEQHQTTWRPGTAVRALDFDGETWLVHTQDQTLPARAVILALGPDACARVLRASSAAVQAQLANTTLTQLAQLEHAPITTVYLRYPESVRLPKAHFALIDDSATQHYGQWVFDRGALDPTYRGVLSVVISGTGPHQDLSHRNLCQAVAKQLSHCLSLPEPLHSLCFVDKRATVLAVPGLKRPDCQQGYKGLFLAGDTAASPFPSTLEGSVRSGIEAADALAKWQNDMAN